MPVSLATHLPLVQPDEPICIIDDDEGVAASLTVLLETFGFDVRSYGSGPDFLADSRHRKAACLIIDEHMPGMTGLDVVAYLQREGVRRPTILISGRLDSRLAQRAAGLGVTRVIEKPFEADRLVDLIRTALSEPN
jgi:two-component system, LuxR family, response regulator FixJ